MSTAGERPALPRGAQDLMPRACARRSRLRDTLLGVFGRRGYRPVAPSAVEYRDVAERGLPASLRERTVRFIEPESGEVAVLRADVTPQVARMVAMRLGGELPEDGVYRFAYAADLMRRPLRPQDRAAHHQVGLELFGDDTPVADAEVVAAIAEALDAAGVADLRIAMSHAAVPRAVMDGLNLDPPRRAALSAALRRRDAVEADRVLASRGADSAWRRTVAFLCDAVGAPEEVLDAARGVPKEGVASAVGRLARVVEALAALAPQVGRKVVVDLAQTRGFDYYTGLRFRVWVPGVPRPVAGGGRYDDLVARYGAQVPAVGGAVDLDALGACAAEGPACGEGEGPVLVAVPPGACRIEAHLRAARIRAEGRTAFVVPVEGESRAEALAQVLGAQAVVWSRRP